MRAPTTLACRALATSVGLGRGEPVAAPQAGSHARACGERALGNGIHHFRGLSGRRGTAGDGAAVVGDPRVIMISDIRPGCGDGGGARS